MHNMKRFDYIQRPGEVHTHYNSDNKENMYNRNCLIGGNKEIVH